MKTRKTVLFVLVLAIITASVLTPALASTRELGEMQLLGNTAIGWDGNFSEDEITHLVMEVEVTSSEFGDFMIVIQGSSTEWAMEETMLATSFDPSGIDFSKKTYLVVDLTQVKGFTTLAASDVWCNICFWSSAHVNLNSVKKAWLTDDKLNNDGAVPIGDAAWYTNADVWAVAGAGGGGSSGGSAKTGDGFLVLFALGALLVAGAGLHVTRKSKVKAK